MESATNQAVLNWCEQNGWKEPQLVATQWWAIAPNSFVPIPIPSEEIASIFGVDFAERERTADEIVATLEAAGEVITRLAEASLQKHQEARDRSNQWQLEITNSTWRGAAQEAIASLELSPEEYQEARDRWNKFVEVTKTEAKKFRQQAKIAKQQRKRLSRNKSQFLQGVEKLLKQGRR